MQNKIYKSLAFMLITIFSNYSLAEMCFLESEESSGLNKICYYNCPSGDAAITVNGYTLCPLSINK
ncbi:hypothetical protein Megvenef_00586 [Candidatus Megaera venefica]|uniref:Secreted protein n=1 Tax=Candidatus Megaera venefica TaxID=2055910 RepID=A0ABU5NBR5_9RICK|nr:hypothetical protein [Candidatus Megaera venefica]MEA0970619.1 hypothetical protein [Candidatus Megaera venefica]